MLEAEKDELLERLEERLGITGSLPDDEQSARSRLFLWEMLEEGPCCLSKVRCERLDQAFAVFSKAPLDEPSLKEWADLIGAETDD